jgi:hypothetical protein
MSDDLSILLDRIQSLLEPSAGVGTTDADDVELTLTDGYARALALEGEQRRVDARIRELAGSAAHAEELRALKERADALAAALGELRGALAILAARV